jgi:hypothetical protein
MDIVLVVMIWAWALLVAIDLSLVLYRVVITHGEYVVLHVRRSELSLIPEQVVHDRRLKLVDFWGQVLTGLALLIALLLAGLYLYSSS